MFDGLQPLKPSKDADRVRSQRQTIRATLLAPITRCTEGDCSKLSFSQRSHPVLKCLHRLTIKQHPTKIQLNRQCDIIYYATNHTFSPESFSVASDKIIPVVYTLHLVKVRQLCPSYVYETVPTNA